MTVCDFCRLYIEDKKTMKIYNADKSKEVFNGTIEEAMVSEFSNEEVLGFGVDGKTVIIHI